MKRKLQLSRSVVLILLSMTVISGCFSKGEQTASPGDVQNVENTNACGPMTSNLAAPIATAANTKAESNWEIDKNANTSNSGLVDLAVQFGPYGEWDGRITLTGGKIEKAAEIAFDPGSGIAEKGENFVTIKGKTDYGINGIRILASVNENATLNVQLKSGSLNVKCRNNSFYKLQSFFLC